jgi:hypothetical protein
VKWNGRQIRNAFQSALAMAEYEARKAAQKKGKNEDDCQVVLGRSQFETIAKTVRNFDKYIEETLGLTYEQKAQLDALRALQKRTEKKEKKEKGRKKDKGKKKKKKNVSSDESSSSSASEHISDSNSSSSDSD